MVRPNVILSEQIPVIAHIVHAIVQEDRKDQLMEHLAHTLLPAYRSAQGNANVQAWLRPCVGYASVEVVSWWKTREDLERFGNKFPDESLTNGLCLIVDRRCLQVWVY